MKIHHIVLLAVIVVAFLIRDPVSRVLGRMTREIGPPNYLNYSPEAFTEYSQSKRAICFMADWDAYDKKVDSQIRSSKDILPADTVIFRADFDNETELKKKHSINIRHECLVFNKEGVVVNRVNPEKILSVLSLQ